MASELKKEIVEYCQQINQKCEIQFENFHFESLKTRQWYLSILQILFPHLDTKIAYIKKMKGEAEAIKKIVEQINDLDQFESLEIDQNKIISGQANQIANLVQVVLALLQIVMQQYEEGEHENQEHIHHQHKNLEAEIQKNCIKQKKSLSDYNKPKSVQAIGNQFQKSEQQQDQDSTPFEKEKLYEQNQINAIQKQKIQTIQMKSRKQDLKQPYKKFSNNKQQDSEQFISESKIQKQKLEQTKKQTKNKKCKNPEGDQAIVELKNKKKLITHPKSPETLKKARSSEAIALTKKVQQDIKKTKKKPKKLASPIRVASPVHLQMAKKNKEHDYMQKEYNKQKRQNQILKTKKKDFSQKNAKSLDKILNWRQERIKKQRQQYEQSMKMRLLTQKQKYIKQINNLIIELQREKQIQQKKDFKQNLIKDNEQAVKRLTALEQWYKNKINLLKQNKKSKRQQRLMIKTGHKQIIGQIQKYLKKQNQQKLLQLTNQYRTQQNHIETDFQQLKDKIIRVYKKN